MWHRPDLWGGAGQGVARLQTLARAQGTQQLQQQQSREKGDRKGSLWVLSPGLVGAAEGVGTGEGHDVLGTHVRGASELLLLVLSLVTFHHCVSSREEYE